MDTDANVHRDRTLTPNHADSHHVPASLSVPTCTLQPVISQVSGRTRPSSQNNFPCCPWLNSTHRLVISSDSPTEAFPTFPITGWIMGPSCIIWTYTVQFSIIVSDTHLEVLFVLCSSASSYKLEIPFVLTPEKQPRAMLSNGSISHACLLTTWNGTNQYWNALLNTHWLLKA